MGWQQLITPLVRGLINDISFSSPTYSDETIHEYIVYAAHFNQSEISYDTTYTINVETHSITPEPSSDSLFCNLTAMRAAIMILNGELKTAASNSVRVSDGPSSLDYTGVFRAKRDLYDKLVESFGKMKMSAALGDLSVGEAILTPYTQEYIYGELFR